MRPKLVPVVAPSVHPAPSGEDTDTEVDENVKVNTRLRPLLRLALVPALLPLLTAGVAARDIHVPGEHPTLNQALKAAGHGDRVVLAPGDYFVREQSLVDGVTIVGDPDDPASVVLDAQGQGRVLRAEGIAQAGLVGLTITGGRADGPTGYHQSGGGILVASARLDLEAVHVRGNLATADGGGIQVLYGEVLLNDVVIADNTASGGGGGVDLRSSSRGEFNRVRFADNLAAWGGGVSSRAASQCWFLDCELVDNVAGAPQQIGGAFFGDYSAAVSFRYCVLRDNVAGQGGAVRLSDAYTTFHNCTVAHNTAAESGGAFMVRGGGVLFEKSIIAFNSGAAVDGELEFIEAIATNIYGNLDGDWLGPLAELRDQANNMETDPLFCGDADLHLLADSPCAPGNNPVGLIGALGVGCTDTQIALEVFTAEISGGQVHLAWTVAHGDGHEFQLTGRYDNDPGIPAWIIPYQAGDEPGTWVAVDKPDLGGVLIYRLEARLPGGQWFELGETLVNPATSITPQPLLVDRVYPNPFNPLVNIELRLNEPLHVRATIYDLQGRRVRSLLDERVEAGIRHLQWDARDDAGRRQSTGTYLLRISDGLDERTVKLLLVK